MAEVSRLGRYELRRILGRGAMGVVYEGFDPNLSRRVAVKTILKSIALDPETDRAYAARFTQEAKAVARLNHPNIVQVYDFGFEGEVAYLVMEYIEGRELRGFFEARENFTPQEVVRIMSELLDALGYAHEAGVIHRDVKPANVMLDARRRAKLADFGVARIQDSAHRSVADTMVGTPAFMSPEQIKGARIDHRTDIFSAGVVLYQLLTGEQPFKGEGAWTVSKKIVEDDPPPPSSVVKTVSPAFDSVVNKALAKSQAQRFASAGDFAAALRSALANPELPAAAAMPKGDVKSAVRATEAEVEFWRSIQNSNDPAEFGVYLQEFPEGIYAQLARIKLAKLNEPIEAARKEAEEKAKRELEERTRAEVQDRARRAAEEKARHAAAEKVRLEREIAERAREAEKKARDKAAESARREAAAKAKMEAEARTKDKLAASSEPAANKKTLAVPAMGAALAVVAGIATYLLLGRDPAPVAVVEAPPAAKAPQAPTATPTDQEKTRRESEERLRRELAEKAAAEKAAVEKALAEKSAAEKAATEKLALAKTQAEKEAADKAAQKAAAERIATEKAMTEKAAASKAAAEKAAADQLAVEKAAAEKAAAEKAAAEKLAAEKLAFEKAAEKLAAEQAAANKLVAGNASAGAAEKQAQTGKPATDGALRPGTTIRSALTVGQGQARLTIPLPGGDWHVFRAEEQEMRMLNSIEQHMAAKRLDIFLIQRVGTRIAMTMRIEASKDVNPGRITSLQVNDPCKRTDTLYRNAYDSGGAVVNCLLINHLTGYLGANTTGVFLDLRNWIKKEGLEFSSTVLLATVAQSLPNRFLTVSVTVHPATRGLDSAQTNWTSNPFHRDLLAKDAERDRYVKEFIAWMEAYKLRIPIAQSANSASAAAGPVPAFK